MKTISVSKAKASLSEQIRHVQRGEEIIITDRGEPVARLLPAAPAATSASLADLARAGVVRLPQHPPDKSFWKSFFSRKRPKDPTASLRSALRQDRDESE